MEFYGSQVVTPGDPCLVMMPDFMAVASVRLAELEDFFTEPNDPFDRVCWLFCEDQNTTHSVL